MTEPGEANSTDAPQEGQGAVNVSTLKLLGSLGVELDKLLLSIMLLLSII